MSCDDVISFTAACVCVFRQRVIRRRERFCSEEIDAGSHNCITLFRMTIISYVFLSSHVLMDLIESVLYDLTVNPGLMINLNGAQMTLKTEAE